MVIRTACKTFPLTQVELNFLNPHTPSAQRHFISGDIGKEVQRTKSAAGNKHAVILGAASAKQVLDAGLLDEIFLHVVPTLLGDGIRVFGHPGGTSVKLVRIDCTHAFAVTNLSFRVKGRSS